ncbi:hypothetical protein SUGI_0353750 [Cryptomeria japonica]|nr:hypothetical protein SUGI_0353750 [Cryptomeria japonica]
MAAELALAAAKAVVGKLGEVGTEQVLNEASLLLNFQEDFQWLQKHFGHISGYLEYADDRNVQNVSVKEWVAEVRNIALDAEDIIDECAVEHLYTKPTQSYSRAVGVEHNVEEIIRLLQKPAVVVVAVVGMGGVGKTFLLQHVYDRIKQRYEHSAWISVSQTYSLRTLQCDLASYVNLQIDGSSSISDVRVAELIHEQLEGKRCLIVLDDVWKSSVEGDLIRRLGLPSGSNNHCKIVVTTRDKDVAANMRAHIYEMQQLSEKDSWNLFCLFAFPDSEENRPPEHLENLAHQIVEKCGRLPLAVKTVAASMARSVGLGDWESKLRQLKDVRVGAEDYTMQILKLSYDSLPSHLKSCFAYFSFFPEDTQIYFSTVKPIKNIHQDCLIYLWIAEGFIPQENEKERWDIGLSYLHQLVNLCLMEVNTVLSCYTIHDLLHDLVVDISKEHKCEFHLPLQETSCWRLLLGKKGITTDAISERPLHRQKFLRTLSLFDNPEITSFPEHLFDRLRTLRVLDFKRTSISALPKCVGEVKSLSHLDVFGCSEDFHSYMPKGMSKLWSLRTLRSRAFTLSIEENEFLNVKDVSNLINLQEISFSLEDERGLRCLEDGILEHLVKMRILRVSSGFVGDIEESNLPVFPERMNAMNDLQKLALDHFSVPSWICGMVNLTELTLDGCSDYPSLQNTPNLQSLILGWDLRCRQLPNNFGICGGFPKLVRLLIHDFPLLEELPELEEGAMQRLEVLAIGNCPQVKKVPEGMGQLRKLKVIKVVNEASGELEERLKEGGEDWNKIKASNSCMEIKIICSV